MPEEVAGEIVLVDLSAIKRNPKNPNYHTADQVQLLAQNIKRYGLRNAIELKKVTTGDDHQYEILTGEGRYLAYCHLRDTEATDEWTRIPAVIREDGADVQTECGRRLSENAVRSFNWVAECIEMATLKENGETTKSLMESFGYGKSTVANMIAVDECLKRADLSKEEMFQLTGTLTRQEFIDHIVPLRVPRVSPQTKKGQRGFSMADPEAYDYAQVRSCIQSILSTELKKEDLSNYSQEHRPAGRIRAVDKKKEEQAILQSRERVEISDPSVGSVAPETKSNESERASEVSPPSVGGEPATTPVQISTDERAESQEVIRKQKETADHRAWIIDIIRAADLKEVSWVLLGTGTPPDAKKQARLGGKQVIVRPDIAERQPVQTKVSRNSRKLSRKAAKPEEEFPDDDKFKACFGQHPGGISECCLLCTDEGECEIASKHAVRCFGKHPEHSDTGLKPSYNCEECSYMTECIKETTAVVDNGKINVSAHYGDLKGSGHCSYLCYVPNDSNEPILVDVFDGKKMLLTSRRYAMAIKPFLKDDTVREIFQQDDSGNTMTRTTKNPTRTLWYMFEKNSGETT